MKKYLILALLMVECLCSCSGYIWVSNLEYLEPIYGIPEKKIIKVDTINTGYEKLLKVKYRLP